jgi:hypothetical protein
MAPISESQTNSNYFKGGRGPALISNFELPDGTICRKKLPTGKFPQFSPVAARQRAQGNRRFLAGGRSAAGSKMDTFVRQTIL